MKFSKTGLSPHLLTTLEKVKLTETTAIQEQAIPLILTGKNVVGIAPTGTGKTLAFALPLMDRLQKDEGIVLILVPTRELALQLNEHIRKVSKGLPRMNPSVLVSGVPLKNQLASLKAHPRIIIATPGRLNEHLDGKTITLNDVLAVVLDEVDRLLDSGFAPQIERILARTAKDRQTLMFSATLTTGIARLITTYAPEAETIIIPEVHEDVSLVEQQVCLIGPTRRIALLTRLLHNTPGKILIFVANKRTAHSLYDAVAGAQFSVAGLHGDRTVTGREEALDGFMKNRYRVLIATDVASRGIDVPTIALVINYDVPINATTYLHRIGRTGRAGKRGQAITFVTPEQRPRLKEIEEELGTTLDIMQKEG